MAEVFTSVGASASSSSGEVTVSGTIIYSDSGNPIDGAIIVVLNPGVDVETWLDSGSDDDVWQFFEVGADGEFAFLLPFLRGLEYPVLVGADGYELLDGFLRFEDSDTDLFTLSIELVR